MHQTSRSKTTPHCIIIAGPNGAGKTTSLAISAGRALRRAAVVARKTARRYGTPVYYAKDGKVVALRP